MKTRLSPLFAAVLGVTCSTAYAKTDIRIDGFLSAGVAVNSNDNVSIGAINDEDSVFAEDTTLGIQLIAPVSERFSLTGQLVARGTEDYQVDASWAYASFQATDELQIRIGRLRIPFYYFSESLEVGYGYHWIRPPEEVYGAGFSNMNSADATYTTELGNVEASFQAYYGRFEGDITVSGTDIPFDLTHFVGGVGTFTWEALTARLSYHQVDIQTPNFPVLPDDAERGGFASGALVYEDSTNFLIIETTQFQIDTAFSDYYSVMASYARTLTDELSAHLTAATREYEQVSIDEKTSFIGGIRYDIETNVALKLEVQHVDQKNAGPGGNGDDGMVYSAAVDMVF